jgi:phytoene synthase
MPEVELTAMQANTHAWEHALLSMAHEGRHVAAASNALRVDAGLLAEAYRHCDSITQQHSRSFHLTSGLLSADKRRAVRALYAFCRTTDDLVDRASSGQTERLAMWRTHILAANPPEHDAVALAWTDTRLRYHVPLRYAEQLIDGVARDLTTVRYETFDQLAAYCYGVASTVGLMSMYIIGFAGHQALPYAIKLGVALQVTNILRDVAEDWRAGRLYLPQADLHAFGLTEADVAEGVATGRVTAQWRALMQYQIARNRRLYQEALPGIQLLAPDGRFAIAAAAGLYSAILEEIEANDYRVFTQRAHVTTWGKLRRLPWLWWQSRCLASIPHR